MIIGLRHGERADKCDSEAEKKKIELYFDPHLTDFGALQAKMSALEIQKRINAYEEDLIAKGLGSGKKITPVILVSPFLRTIQTAFNVAKNLDRVYENTIFVQNELTELLWNEQEFNIDPLPLLFSRNRKIEDFIPYGADFIHSGIKIDFNPLFKDPEFIQPKYPEKKVETIKRAHQFFKRIPHLFFEKFKFNEHVLIWISHQYILASAIWYYTDLVEATHSDSLVQICGIFDTRFPDLNNLEKYKLLQIGTSPHLDKLENPYKK